MTQKPSFCQHCPINHVTKGYVPLKPGDGDILFCGEAAGENEAAQGLPFVGGAGEWLRNLCKAAKIPFDHQAIINTIGCQPPDNVYPGSQLWSATSREVAREGLDYCARMHFWPGVAKANKRKIIALGAQATERLTGKSGITLWRGSPLPIVGQEFAGPKVMPTLHPAALMRQAKFFSVVIGDLKKSLVLPPERYNLWPTLEEVRRFAGKRFAFDFEWDRDGNITLCGLTDRMFEAMVVPFTGNYIHELQRIFQDAEELIGHNIINADMSHIERLGWQLKDDVIIHDTMLKQHLVQPDFPHDLGFVASVFTNKVFWKGKGRESEDEDGNLVPGNIQWKTWDNPKTGIPVKLGGYFGSASADEAYRLYNARDTDGEFQINLPLDQLLKRYGQEDVYWNVSVPVAYICREIGERGFKLDRTRLHEIRATLEREISAFEGQLPEGLRPFDIEVPCNLPAPPGTWKAKTKVCKHGRKSTRLGRLSTNSDPGVDVPPDSNITFTTPDPRGCPVCGKEISPGKMVQAKIIKGTKMERVVPYNSPQLVQKYITELGCKTIRDAKTGNITTGKRARKIWGRDHPEFTILDSLKKKLTLKTNFAKDTIMLQERMFFNLKVHGTSEGRLASSGRRDGIDLNVQNQPDEFRIIYIPDFPEWGLLNLDISQGENMLTTWLAKDWPRWERLHTKGYDEHCDLASRIFGRTITKNPEDKPFRDVGKKINHGRNYGMGVRKQRDFLIEEGYNYSEGDVKEFIEIWKEMNARTAVWQVETIALATAQGFLANPFGRRRWFQSRDLATKALAFLPASTLADMVLRMMIGHYPTRREMIGPISRLGILAVEMCEGWRMAAQVHDSIVLMGPKELHQEQARRSSLIMCQPWPQLACEMGEFQFSVDVKYSEKSWGDVEKIKV